MYIIYKHRILSFMKVTAGGDILWCVKCLVYECYCTKMGGPPSSSLAPTYIPTKDNRVLTLQDSPKCPLVVILSSHLSKESFKTKIPSKPLMKQMVGH